MWVLGNDPDVRKYNIYIRFTINNSEAPREYTFGEEICEKHLQTGCSVQLSEI